MSSAKGVAIRCAFGFLLTGAAAVSNASAGTLVVDSVAAFNAATTGQTPLNFNNVSTTGGGPNYASYPSITEGIATFAANPSPINANSASLYGTSGVFITNSYQPGATTSDTLTITLSSSVTAFALDFGTDGVSSAAFSLSNGYGTEVTTQNSYTDLTFAGFVSSTPFDSIELAVANPNGWGVLDFETAAAVTPTPLPAALPLFAGGLGALGLLGLRRKRTARSVAV
jgi:hypothetical protein